MKSKIVTFLVSASIVLFALPSISNANESDPQVEFDSPELESQISQETIDYLLEQAEGDDITIHGVTEPDDEDTSESITPYALHHSYSVTAKIFNSRAPQAAAQYASVARGKTLTLSSTFKTTNSVSISGGIPTGAGSTIKANFGTSKTKTIKKGVKLKGPGKGYSSRNYYITRFQDRGKFNLIQKNIFTGKKTTFKKTYSKPSSQDPFVDWSRDIK